MAQVIYNYDSVEGLERPVSTSPHTRTWYKLHASLNGCWVNLGSLLTIPSPYPMPLPRPHYWPTSGPATMKAAGRVSRAQNEGPFQLSCCQGMDPTVRTRIRPKHTPHIETYAYP